MNPIALRKRWPGLSADKSFVVPILKSRWAPPSGAIVLGDRLFEPKRELHVTVLGSGAIEKVRAAIDCEGLTESDLASAYEAQPWSLTRGSEWRRIGRTKVERGIEHYAESVIERVELPALRLFVEAVSAALGEQLPVPPPHVTLYTSGDGKGIGLVDEAALERMTIEIFSELPRDAR